MYRSRVLRKMSTASPPPVPNPLLRIPLPPSRAPTKRRHTERRKFTAKEVVTRTPNYASVKMQTNNGKNSEDNNQAKLFQPK